MFLVPAVKDFLSELLAGPCYDVYLLGDKRARLFYTVMLCLCFAIAFCFLCIDSSKPLSPYVSISAEIGFPSLDPGVMLLSCSFSTYLFGLCQSLLIVGLRLAGDFNCPNLVVLLENPVVETCVGLV